MFQTTFSLRQVQNQIFSQMDVSIQSSFSWWLTKSKGITSLNFERSKHWKQVGIFFSSYSPHQVLDFQTIWNQSGKSPIFLTQNRRWKWPFYHSLSYWFGGQFWVRLLTNLTHSSTHILQLDWVWSSSKSNTQPKFEWLIIAS